MSQKPLKITVNYTPEVAVEFKQWPLVPSVCVRENNRVSVEFDGLCYGFVLDPDKPRVEVWNLDAQGELKDIVAHYPLPTFPNLKSKG